MAEKKEGKRVPLTEEAKKLLSGIIQDSSNDVEIEYVETGNIGFDFAITNGKGLPIGSSILFWADAGVGKTTLVGDICKRLLDKYTALDKPFKVLYIATEPSKELLKDLGLSKYFDSEDFIYVDKPMTWRTIETIYEGIFQGFKTLKDIKLIVIDSIGNVMSDQNTKSSIADGDYGTKAKERANFYSKYLPVCLQKGISSFFISQVRQDQNAGLMQDNKKAAVSFADRHNVEIILKCGKKSNLTDAGKVAVQTIFGETKEQKRYIMTLNSSASSCKNRFFEGIPSEVLVEKGIGINNTYVMRKLLEGNKYLKKTGGWYVFDSDIAGLIGAPTGTNLRLSAVNQYLQDNIGKLVQFLKEANQYQLKIKEENLGGEDEDFSEEGSDE